MRLTLRELHAIAEAIGLREAGEMDGLTDAEIRALETAGQKVRVELARREDKIAGKAGSHA